MTEVSRMRISLDEAHCLHQAIRFNKKDPRLEKFNAAKYSDLWKVWEETLKHSVHMNIAAVPDDFEFLKH